MPINEVDVFFDEFAVDAIADDGKPVRLIIDEIASTDQRTAQRPRRSLRTLAQARTIDIPRLTLQSAVTIGDDRYRVESHEEDLHGITPVTLQRWPSSSP